MAERRMAPISRRHPTSESEDEGPEGGHVEEPLEDEILGLANEPEGDLRDSIAGGGGCVIPEERNGDEDEEEMPSEEEIAKKFFTCHICMDILDEAIVFGCGHIMCVKCTYSWIAVKPIENPVCPTCKVSYNILPRKCELLRTLVQKLKPLATNQVGPKVQVEDVICFSCKNILYNPSVLNCGHVFCISCVVSTNGAASRCNSCGALHASAPTICLELKGFLEMYFKSEYRSRGEELHWYTCTSAMNAADKPLEAQSEGIKILETHVGVGCDSCGVYPIQGNRYHCMTCNDIDLCEPCSKIDWTIKGRSGEVHSSNHILELDDSFQLEKVLAVLNEEGDDEGERGEDEGEFEEGEEGAEEWPEDLGGINAGFRW